MVKTKVKSKRKRGYKPVSYGGPSVGPSQLSGPTTTYHYIQQPERKRIPKPASTPTPTQPTTAPPMGIKPRITNLGGKGPVMPSKEPIFGVPRGADLATRTAAVIEARRQLAESKKNLPKEPPRPKLPSGTKGPQNSRKGGKRFEAQQESGGNSSLALKVVGGLGGALYGGLTGGPAGAIQGAKRGASAVDKVTDLIEYAAGGAKKREEDLADKAIKLAEKTHDTYQAYKGKFGR